MSRAPHQLLDDLEARILAIRVAARLMRQGEEAADDDLAATSFDAVLYGLVVLGEAIRNLPPGFRDSEPGLPWEAMVGMRNVIAHEYFRIDSEIVSRTLVSPLEALLAAVGRMRNLL